MNPKPILRIVISSDFGREHVIDRLKGWALGALLCAHHFPQLHLNPGRDCHELKGGHSLELVWLKSIFMHWLKFWVRGALLCANHFQNL
jgi:hypothetical protein